MFAIEIAIGAISTLLGMAVTYFTFMRGRDKEIKTDAQEQAKVSYKLDHIGSGVDDIRLDLKDSDRQIGQINESLIRVDESVKSAHKRIDKIDKGV